jgi:hypothetical protein
MTCDLAGGIGGRITGRRGEGIRGEQILARAPRETVGRGGTAIGPMSHRS